VSVYYAHHDSIISVSTVQMLRLLAHYQQTIGKELALSAGTDMVPDPAWYLAVHKVFGRIRAKIRVFRRKLGHLGVETSEYFVNGQVSHTSTSEKLERGDRLLQSDLKIHPISRQVFSEEL